MTEFIARLFARLAELLRPSPSLRPVSVSSEQQDPEMAAADIEALSQYRLASLMQYPHF
jgi:hypothetical protein